MGYRTFNVGEVFTSAEAQELMDQSIVHCTSTTRPTGVPTGQLMYETDTETYYWFNGTSWLALPFGGGGGPSGRRNVIRNGDMAVAQRGNGPFALNGTGPYTLDGWRSFSNKSSDLSVSRVATTPGEEDAAWFLEATTSNQGLSDEYSRIAAVIENVRTLAGRAVTLSFRAKAGAGTTPKIGIEIEQNFGPGIVREAIQAVTISDVTDTYVVQFTMPSIVGHTIGSNDNLTVNFWLSAGLINDARASSIGIQNATISITDVQLEQGGLTPFERLSEQEQLAWCQRYFVRYGGKSDATAGVGSGLITGSNNVQVILALPVPMRSTPIGAISGIITCISGGPSAVAGFATNTIISISSNANCRQTILANFSPSVSLTPGYSATLYMDANDTHSFDLSAEL